MINNYINIINNLNPKQITIAKEKQYITFNSSYNFKYKCYECVIEFKKKFKSNLGNHYNTIGCIYGWDNNFELALIRLFENPNFISLSDKQQKALNKLTKTNTNND